MIHPHVLSSVDPAAAPVVLWEAAIGLVIIEAMACQVLVAAYDSAMRAKAVEPQRNHVGEPRPGIADHA